MEIEETLNYLRPEDRIYEVAINRDELDWKGFLHNLISSEGLDPFDIDLSILTKKYLEALKEINEIDFNISGKFLTIAVFLLKIKAKNLIDVEIRGLEIKIDRIKNIDDENFNDEIDDLENLEVLNNSKKKTYNIIARNPLARKRKVNIFDLIKTLEKTFEQSNKRKLNFFLRNSNIEYEGPNFEKKPKDLKIIIEELYSLIINNLKDKKGHICFHHLVDGINHKEGILDKFLPMLHLHNNGRIEISQEEHFGEIKISKVNE